MRPNTSAKGHSQVGGAPSPVPKVRAPILGASMRRLVVSSTEVILHNDFLSVVLSRFHLGLLFALW